MFRVFDVRWKGAREGLDEMGDVGREMVSWTITPRNKRAERTTWLVNFGYPIEEWCVGICRYF